MAYPCCDVTIKILLMRLKINPRWRTVRQPDSQGLHLRYPRYSEDPDTGWSRGTQVLGA